MKAIVQDAYGLPDVLQLREIDRPTPLANEVLVRVRGSSVNPADWIALTGRPYAGRLAFGLLRPRRVPGMDVAGEVAAIGSGVTRFGIGDAVFGEIFFRERAGAFAEYVCVPEKLLALKPANLSFEHAAAVPLAAMPALQGLRDKARVKPGNAVLINGASGGVGTFAVQIAKALGAEVTGVCSTRNVELVRSIGADHVVDYTREDFTQTAARYDVILDLVGSASIASCRRALRPGGVYLASVGRLGWSLKAFMASVGSKGSVVPLASHPNAEDLGYLKDLLEAGTVRPVIDRTYTLDEVPEALRRQGEGHARGKSVITV